MGEDGAERDSCESAVRWRVASLRPREGVGLDTAGWLASLRAGRGGGPVTGIGGRGVAVEPCGA